MGAPRRDLVPLLDALRVPSIVVLHTVLARPTPRQRAILDEVIGAASAVVTMTRTARTRLLDSYGADPEKVVVIPHGAADNRVPATPRKAGQPPMVPTWGLLGPGKGIQHAIARSRCSGTGGGASPTRSPARRTGARGPATARPTGVCSSGASAQGVADLLRFDPRFLPADALGDLIAAADVVVLPYDSLEQVTSGVLIEASPRESQ